MHVEVGSVLEGKVTGIASFGAFVQLPGGKTGLVHISEVSSAYVNDLVKDHLKEGQKVKVKVIGAENGKISLSSQTGCRKQYRQRGKDRKKRKTQRPQAQSRTESNRCSAQTARGIQFRQTRR